MVKPFTVAQLIEALQGMPSYAIVCTNNAPSRRVVDVVTDKSRGETFVILRSEYSDES